MSNGHTCHWPGCEQRVPPARWGCRAHWFALPLRLRNRIWATYVPGQEITKTPSAAYIAAAKDVRAWIDARHQQDGGVVNGTDRTTSGRIGQP